MKLKALPSLIIPVLLLFLWSCGDSSTKGDDTNKTVEKKGKKPAGNASVLKVGDKLFNVPSPLETAFLIEKTGGNFNQTILSREIDANKFTTTQERALNLGVLGADLGYSLIHEQSQMAFTLLANCKKLGTEIGISPALYAGFISRFEGNLDSKDSLLSIVSDLNRLSDEYLKENQSEDISAMILAGGWVESLYFAVKLYEATDNAKLRQRIAEQKKTIDNLIGLLRQQDSTEEFEALIKRFEDLKASYATVTSTYAYAEPETDAEQHLTVIKSQNTIEMSDEALTEISAKISALRNDITGNSNS